MKTITILGVRVDCLSTASIAKQCEEWITGSDVFHQIVTVNPEFVMEAQENHLFREIINSAALATADGVGLLFASLYLHHRRLYRYTGVDLTMKLAELCARTGKRMYLLGAGSGVAEKVAIELKKRYPSLIIVGAEEGIQNTGFRVEGIAYSQNQKRSLIDQQICQRIGDSRADVLLVAFGAPKQDIWIAQNAAFLPTIKIALGVGGAFDYLAGVIARAPRVFRAVGFEWTYRLMTQPYRWRRIITAVIRFPLAVLFSAPKALSRNNPNNFISSSRHL